MINVKEAWDLTDYITNKENEGNTTTPDQRNMILKAANIDIFKHRYGLPEEYQPGMPMPRIAYEATQKITDDMRDLKVVMGDDAPIMMVDEYGKADVPEDYLHFVGAHVVVTKDIDCVDKEYDYNMAEHLTTAQIQERLGNSIKKPTIKDPVFETRAGYFQWHPKNINNVIFSYIRKPKTPYYAYTIENDIVIYNEENSVHFEYPSDMFVDVVSVLLGYVGVSMRDGEIAQYAERKKQTGR